MPTYGSTSSKAPKIAGTGTGTFINQKVLVGELVIVTPVSLKEGIYNEGKPDERKTRQLVADVVVLTGVHAGNHPSVFLSGGKIIDLGLEILEAKADTVLAGRMTRTPLKKYRASWPTPAALEAAISDPKVVVPDNAYVWLIPDPSQDDLALVMAYYEGGQQAPTAEDDESEGDPFDD